MPTSLEQFAASIVQAAVPFLDKGRTRAGLDCWGVLWLAYAEVYGIALPGYDERYADTSDPGSLEELIRRERETGWRRVERPGPGDAVVFRVSGCNAHVGLVLDQARMLHAQEGTDACVERFDCATWCKRVEGFWRHESRRG